MSPRPVAPAALPELLAGLCARALSSASGRLRVVVDGAPAADPGALADSTARLLRAEGHPVARVSADDFLRAASLRLEHGRHDTDAYLDDRLDLAALRRELLDPWGPGGSGRYLPTFWDAARDRATRAGYLDAPDRGVLLCDGALLLGRDLPFDLAVHLRLSPGALLRRTPADERWALPAYERYAREHFPDAEADVVVRWDDPRHPAVEVIPRRASG
ncbi:MAG: uridine kinase [Cryptosporangiaceae bacterium]|nr:uridine kinase [Cryptosporangiaceae bacterium]